jgi:hypothetical protein
MGTTSQMGSQSVSQNFPSNVSSTQNSISTSGVGLQGYANDFPNSSRPIFPNRRSLRYLPYRERLNRMNNSSIIGNFNHRPSVNMNDVQFHSHVTQEREIERHAVDIQDTDAWTRPSINFTLLDSYYEGAFSQKKELLLFKDEKKAMPTSSNVETYDANDNEENLDLSLHL